MKLSLTSRKYRESNPPCQADSNAAARFGHHTPSARRTGRASRKPRPMAGLRGASKKEHFLTGKSPPFGRGASHFSTLHLLASLNGKFGTAPLFYRRKIGALSPFSIKALRCGGKGPRKISNARFREMMSNALIPQYIHRISLLTPPAPSSFSLPAPRFWRVFPRPVLPFHSGDNRSFSPRAPPRPDPPPGFARRHR